MNIKVYSNRETIPLDDDVFGTQNENNVTTLKIEVPEKYKNWNKRIVFITDNGNKWDMLGKDNTYVLQRNITKYEEIEAYIWLTEKEDAEVESVDDFRSKTFTLSFFANEKADDLIAKDEQIDGFNSMLTALNVEIDKVEQINTDFTKLKEDVEKAETERTTAENNRSKAENGRIKSEQGRKTAEDSRISAEEIRKKNESNRIVNENGRVEAENTRKSGETTRISNENERIENENKRITAEEKRQTDTTNAINNINNLNEEYKQLAEEKTEELTEIADGVKDMATAIQLPQFYVDDEMDIHGVTATKLSNIDLYYDDETGDFKEGVI